MLWNLIMFWKKSKAMGIQVEEIIYVPLSFVFRLHTVDDIAVTVCRSGKRPAEDDRQSCPVANK